MRSVLADLLESDGGFDHVVVDMEAGLEHLSRGTTRHVDVLLAVAEPYYRSLETARRVCGLAAELGIRRVHLLPNKVRATEEADAIRDFAERHGLSTVGEIPYDQSIADADLRGDPCLSLDDPASVAAARLHLIVQELTTGRTLAA